MENKKSKLQILKRPIVLIVLLGCLLRIISLSVNHDEMRWQNDARMSIPAVRLLEGKGLTLTDGSGPTAYRPPLYIFWLTASYAIFGKFATFGPSALQIIVSTGNIVLLFLLTKQIWKREDIANASAFLLAIHPYTVYHDAALYHTFLSTALLLSAFLFLFKGIESKRPIHFLLSGISFGLGVLITSVIVPFLGILVFLGLCIWKNPWRNRLALTATFAIGIALFWGPWIIRNALVFNAFIPLTTESGSTLWIGNNPLASELLPKQEHESAPVPDGTAFSIPEQYVGCRLSRCVGGVSEHEENKALTALAIQWIKTHPMEFAKLTVWRMSGIWSPALTPHKNVTTFPLLNFLITYGYLGWNLTLFFLFYLGTREVWKENKKREWALMLLLAITSTGAYALFLYYTKYRIPFEAVLLSICGAGLIQVAQRVRASLPLK